MVKPLAPEKVQDSMRFSATVEPHQTVELAFRVAGTVERLYRVKTAMGERDVQEGDVVPKGEVIAQLELRDYQREAERAKAELDRATANIGRVEANLRNAQREFERARDLFGKNVAAKKDLDEATARREVAEADLAAAKNEQGAARVAVSQAEDKLADCTLRVPIDHATVVWKKIEPAERIEAQRVVFRIMDMETVHVQFGVPEAMLGDPAMVSAPVRVSLGQGVDVFLEAFEGRRFEGRITKIAPAADANTRTFLTEVTLDNRKGLIKPGMIATVHLGEEKEAVLLPMTAIQRGAAPGETVVFQIDEENGKSVARRRRVDLGGVYNNQVEVKVATSKVRVGDRIAVTGAWRLDEGTEVRVIEKEPERILP
jgi:RND family efflux transporter MFP subunit